ncbi:hypothetical protein H0H92_004811 [Tricholoma furcatifolium]|nr:hypothetical protein H0H92_004811 [Tricholoma furcatifolium]
MVSPSDKLCSVEFSLLADRNSCPTMETHDLLTAPLITREAYDLGGHAISTPQYEYTVLSLGSGKSHTVSVMLENMTVACFPPIGSLTKPLSTLVLHFGEGGSGSLPCEAAWLAIPSIPGITPPEVRVYVSPSSINTMRALYAPLGSNIVVKPLTFSESDLDAEAFFSMMSVGSSETPPLYIQVIRTILRGLGENFTYNAFMRELDVHKKSFNPAQISGLQQRMSLLNSFLEKPKKSTKGSSRFAAGKMTIIDLSDPFIDSSSACGLFDIVTRLFVRSNVDTGKVLVVDEAHKYLSSNDGSSGLTASLTKLIRQQRHLSMRVIISTQEPTAVPRTLIDLCNIVLLHRFSSPSWWEYLVKHVAADFEGSDAFDKVVKLQTGEAIVLAPSALGAFILKPGSSKSLGQWGRRYTILKTRKRVTKDGGASILILDSLSP